MGQLTRLSGFALLVCSLALLLAWVGPLPSSATEPEDNGTRFDGERAFRDLSDLVSIGPRPPGSAAAAKARALIIDRLRQAGFVTTEAPFSIGGSGSPERLANVVGRLAGTSNDLIVLTAHFDTPASTQRIVGANCGASGVALLLELARELGRSRPKSEIALAFLDGTEPQPPDQARRFAGARSFAAQLGGEGELTRLLGVITVDRAADRELQIAKDALMSANMGTVFSAEIARLQLEDRNDIFTPIRLPSEQDVFIEVGAREVLALYDPLYGEGSIPGSLTRSPQDTLDRVSAESLGVMGELVLGIVRRLDSQSSRAHRKVPG